MKTIEQRIKETLPKGRKAYTAMFIYKEAAKEFKLLYPPITEWHDDDHAKWFDQQGNYAWQKVEEYYREG